MRVQICEPRPIPEGYTFTRCNHYTKKEFMEMYKDGNGNISFYCVEYMRDHPKKNYTVDDRIAIREIIKDHMVGSISGYTGINNSKTTKRYDHDHWEGKF